MAKGIFVTGTDTGVGKTLIAAGLACCLQQRGVKVAVMKAVQTGGVTKNGHLVSEDLELLQAGIELDEPLELLNPYCLPEPCSPHLAARLAGTEIEPDRIISAYNQLASRYELVIVEGAGGLLVPLREDFLMADLVKELDLPLLIAADNKLGVINHTLLTVECARGRELKLLGVVLNQTKPLAPSPIQADNPLIIARISGVPLLGVIPYHQGEQSSQLQAVSSLWEHKLHLDSLLASLNSRIIHE